MGRYRDQLKAAGASDDDLKALIPDAKYEKHMDGLLDKAAEAETARQAAEAKVREYDTWYDSTLTPAYQKLQNEAVQARAEAARNAAALKAAQEYGLAKIAEQQDNAAAAGTPAAGAPAAPAFDASKYVPLEVFQQAFGQTGKAIAIANKVNNEHRKLFGDDPDMEALLEEAQAAKKPLREYWEQKYNVAAKRKEVADAAQAARDKKIADDAIAKYQQDHPSSNPHLSPPLSSSFPGFNKRSGSDGKAAVQPWDNANEREGARLEKATRKIAEQGQVH